MDMVKGLLAVLTMAGVLIVGHAVAVADLHGEAGRAPLMVMVGHDHERKQQHNRRHDAPYLRA